MVPAYGDVKGQCVYYSKKPYSIRNKKKPVACARGYFLTVMLGRWFTPVKRLSCEAMLLIMIAGQAFVWYECIIIL